MLEIRGISKTYRAKSGVEVKALDNVNLTFPENGMIFLLGKSGSGKSTLLNVIGGLDTYDEGEFIIRGKSSREFGRSDFDSYRNTFIGFIFQEYNILDDFSVGANIALALELQGKRATSEEINRILHEVDLDGFGNRKPNELSGGQKQRIAIARALIKEPQIIMADEPTGALDSTTGAQVLETLKHLSREKLVIVVSHDRDFAEQYGDRIIELSDGCVVSDTSFTDEDAIVEKTQGMQIVAEDRIDIAEDYILTASDLAAINAHLATYKSDITISRGGKTREKKVRKQAPTGEVATGTYEKGDTKFIRSRLPIKKAAMMGLSGIKSKPIRLLFTIVLSLVAFSLFGFADTLIAYNKMEAATNSLRDMEARAIVLSLRLRQTYTSYDENGEVTYTSNNYYDTDAFSDADIADLERQTGLKFFPVYNGASHPNSTISLDAYLKNPDQLYNQMSGTVFRTGASGITEMGEDDFRTLGFTLSDEVSNNRYPEEPGEIAIPYYYYKMFDVAGFKAVDEFGDPVKGSIVGKTLSFGYGSETYKLKVVGVVDTGFDFDKYPALKWDAAVDSSYDSEDLYDMRQALEKEVVNSFHSLLYAAPGTLETLPKITGNDRYVQWGAQFWGSNLQIGWTYRDSSKEEFFSSSWAEWMVNDSMLSSFDIVWADGEEKEALGRNDYVISAEAMIYASDASRRELWNMSPIPALAPLLEQNGYGGFQSAIYHWQNADIFADFLKISVPAYEAQLRDNLNRVYGLNYTIDDYKAIACLGVSRLDSVSNLDRNNLVALSVMREVYQNYDRMHDAINTDADFLQYLRDMYGLPIGEGQTLDDFLNTMVQSDAITAASRRGVTADLAGGYMTHFLEYYGKDFSGRVFGMDFQETINNAYVEAFENMSEEDRTVTFRLTTRTDNGEERVSDHDYEITGIYIPAQGMRQDNCLISLRYAALAQEEYMAMSGGHRDETTYGSHESGQYAMLICQKPNDTASIEKVVALHQTASGDYVFRVESDVMSTLDLVNELIVILDKVFLGVGIFFALFASLMMFNFISASITNKKREIGILRAVGARSRDVFLIFFTEAFFVALVNFLLATVVSGVGIFAVNMVIRNMLGFNLTLFSFGIRQVAVLFAVSVGVALVSSFLPTNKIARKTPVDAMRDR